MLYTVSHEHSDEGCYGKGNLFLPISSRSSGDDWCGSSYMNFTPERDPKEPNIIVEIDGLMLVVSILFSIN